MLKRIISGICLVAIAVPSLYFGGWLLYAVCLMVALIGNFELLRVTNLQKTPLGICAYAATIAYFISLNIAEHRYTTLILVLTFLVMMSVYVFTFPKYKAENVMWAFFGIIYVKQECQIMEYLLCGLYLLLRGEMIHLLISQECA